MPWFEHLIARSVRPHVSRHHLALGDDLDRVDVALDRECGKRKTSRHAVTVAVEGHRLILVDLRFLPDARVETMFGQCESRLVIEFKTMADRFALAADDAIAIGFAAPQQIGVEFVKVLNLGNRSCPTLLQILHAVFRIGFFVAASRHAKQRLEVIMAGKRGVAVVQFTSTSREDLRRHGFGVVPPCFTRYTIEKLKSGLHAVQNRFGPFRRQSNSERAIRICPRQHQHGNLSSSVGKVDVDVTVVDFESLTRIMHKRDESLPPSATPLAHITPHLIVATPVTLFDQTTKDLLRRMPLFPRLLLVVFENLIDSRMEVAKFRRPWRLRACVRLGLGLIDHLPHLPPRMPKFLHDSPKAHPIAISATNPRIIVHRKHSLLSVLMLPPPKEVTSYRESYGAAILLADFPAGALTFCVPISSWQCRQKQTRRKHGRRFSNGSPTHDMGGRGFCFPRRSQSGRIRAGPPARFNANPLGALRDRLDELPKDKEIITFCKISLRGYEAALILKAAGFERVRVMDGGIAMWPFEKLTGSQKPPNEPGKPAASVP